ncbi:AAA family ATPase [uncultured Megasphaera sp.]|uniref:AAA family ATPase n=1 Tax=uncultured Megasphaera sp. TaxID=165188 RepID=UPI0025973D6C|nr:AAA family ATPase [uncultured Megasphaera sp.]
MKITQMHLDDFGIYHHVEWTPPEQGLMIIHGLNESGKTTLMKYVRSMFFGYPRGEWKGFFGHIDIRRHTGKAYRIYRNEKEFYIADGDTILYEEPSTMWWHGLDRQTYDKIFAIGLEDLQGFKILSNEEVRSHFFSIEGGVRMGTTRREFIRRMGELLVPSSQGKKVINVLLQEQKEYAYRIDKLVYDEDEFAQLQAQEKRSYEEVNQLRLQQEELKMQMEQVLLPMSAWNIYQRGQAAQKKMQELASISQFPQEGLQQESEIESNISRLTTQIQKQQRLYQEKNTYHDEWKNWEICGKTIEKVYDKVHEWKQYEQILQEKEQQAVQWKQALEQEERKLRPYFGTSIARQVDWQDGFLVAQKYAQVWQQLLAWKARKPKSGWISSTPEYDQAQKTEAYWQQQGPRIEELQQLIHTWQKIQAVWEMIEQDKQTPKRGLMWGIWGSLSISIISAGLAFWQVVPLFWGYMVAVFFLIVLVILGYMFLMGTYTPKKEVVHEQLQEVENKICLLSKQGNLGLDGDFKCALWQQKIEDMKRQYAHWQADYSKYVWKKEQKELYQSVYGQWKNEGKQLKASVRDVMDEWKKWYEVQGIRHLPHTDFMLIQQAWKRWYSYQQQLCAWKDEKVQMQRQVEDLTAQAKQLFKELSFAENVTPDNVVLLYKKWQTIRVQAEVAREQDHQRVIQKQQEEQLQREKARWEEKQRQLFQTVRVKTSGEFRDKALQYQQFCQYKEIYRQSEDHLRLLAKTSQALKQLKYDLQHYTVKDWQDKRIQYEQKIKELEQKIADIVEHRGSIVERLSQMAKNEEYNRLLQEQQHRKALLDNQVDNWLMYMFAEHMMGEAQAYYERVRQPIVIRKAGEYLQEMTARKYTLQASFDGKQLYAVDNTQRRIPEKQWSSGLGDQIYLAVRISLAVVFSQQLEPMPIVLDDILVRFDEERQKAALRFLAKVGEKEQVFLFTCSRMTRNIAIEVQQEEGLIDSGIHIFEINKGSIQPINE